MSQQELSKRETQDYESRTKLMAEEHGKALEQLKAAHESDARRRAELFSIEKQRLDEQVRIHAVATHK